MKWLLTFASFLSLIAPITAQSKSTLELHTGTILRGHTTTSSFTVQTEFGVQEIPVTKINSIDFGFHYLPKEEAELTEAARNLTSAVISQREKASKLMQSYGKRALPFLVGKDAEFIARSKILKSAIVESEPGPYVEDDVVQTSRYAIIGKIKQSQVEFNDDALGQLKIDIYKVKRFTCNAFASIVLDITELRGNWFETSIRCNINTRLGFVATGETDCFPTTPGTYTCGPDGLKNAPSGEGGIRAGTLVGRIGNNPPFIIGEKSQTVSNADGNLFLRVVPNPWNVPNSGEYRLRVEVK